MQLFSHLNKIMSLWIRKCLKKSSGACEQACEQKQADRKDGKTIGKHKLPTGSHNLFLEFKQCSVTVFN